MKHAFISSLRAWGVGAVFIMAVPLILCMQQPPGNYRFEEAIGLVVWIATLVGIVVFPTCMLVVAPILKLLPCTSPLWNPPIATAIGAIAGPCAMYAWAAAWSREIFLPDYHNVLQMIPAGGAFFAGATFAYSYARLKQR